jgi:steroid delta-isomerase-like uncharacterized protein
MSTTGRIIIAALCGALVLGCQSDRERNAQVEKMFRDYCATWSTHDVDRMATFFTDDCIYENVARGETYRGRDQVKAWAKASFQSFPDFRLEVTSLIVSGDRLACEWTMSGTHTGSIQGLPATGKTFSVRGSTVVQLKGLKIARNADYWDVMGFLRQLGMIGGTEAGS